MNNLETYSESIFENIKHIDEFGNEYWDARELMPLLEYSKWRIFIRLLNARCWHVKLVITMFLIIFLSSGKR